MKVNGTPYRTIWQTADGQGVEILDQTRFPHEFVTVTMTQIDDAAHAISSMQVRGAPLIGATAAYGFALALRDDPSDSGVEAAYEHLIATRPTAVNLRWALERMRQRTRSVEVELRAETAFAEAAILCDEDAATNEQIGVHGLEIIRDIAATKPTGEPVRILTHCNAGWLATVDWGTATAPMYKAYEAGIPIHVYVDETRPRNQGAHLTAWELGQHGVDHTVIVDNAGGHLMQHGQIDLCLVGSDRTTAAGDVCNKIGTYLKALAARDNDIPFFVTLPVSTIDFTIEDGLADIPIEERAQEEVRWLHGRTADGVLTAVDIMPPASTAGNPAFDVTPARLVSGLITEQGVVEASLAGIAPLNPLVRAS